MLRVCLHAAIICKATSWCCLTTHRIERNVPLNSSEAQDLTVKKDQSSGAALRGIDQVLDTIKGPKAVSTVAKSSMDWDVYKEKEGLDEDLSAAAKDG